MPWLSNNWEAWIKNVLLGFLLAIPWLFYYGHESSKFMAMINGIVFLLARMCFLECFEIKLFFSYGFGISLMPALILFLHEIYFDGKADDHVTSLLLKELPMPFSIWQLSNMVLILQVIVIWNSCFRFSFIKKNELINDKYSASKRTLRIVMFLFDALLVTLCLCRYQNLEMPMVLFYLCMLLSSLGIQYIQAYLSLRPFELCLLSSLYFGFLYVEFTSALALNQMQEFWILQYYLL